MTHGQDLHVKSYIVEIAGVRVSIPVAFKQYLEGQGEFPGGPVVKTQHFHCRGMGSVPGWGTKIPYAESHGQK